MYLQLGSKGDLVRELQAKLIERGQDPGPVNGIFGENTRKALVKFQEESSLNKDGIAGPNVFKKLEIAVKIEKPEAERERFRSLLMANPNYFGTIVDSPYAPVLTKKYDIAYEELKCVGYNPHTQQLMAVVHVKKNYGYGGDICSTGTPEYIRFYIDWNNNGSWTDAGIVSFRAYNMPGSKPLEYAVTLDIAPKKKACKVENLPAVRAILSWNDPPGPNDPEYPPVWGNVKEARIQIDKAPDMAMLEIPDKAMAKLIEEVGGIDLDQKILLSKPKPLTMFDLTRIYKKKSVPAHRFTYPKVHSLLAKPVAANVMHQEIADVLSGLETKPAQVIEDLAATSANTRFEELKCIGFDSQRKLLTGILTVKLPYGYSGNLCDDGSKQYVAFWEWDEIEGMWCYLGTSVVKAYDFKSIPNEGLQYAVCLSADFSHRRWPCIYGTSEATIRATLSWEVPPRPNDAYWVPTWGNSRETRIHIKPGPEQTGEQVPYIETVGNMHVCNINQVSGLATGKGMIADFDAEESPFGRSIAITGYIDNPPLNVMEGGAALRYKVSVRPVNLASPQIWQPLANNFDVWVREETGLNPPVHKRVVQKIDSEGYYTYLEDPGDPVERHYVLPVLARWHTPTDSTGLWEIKIEAKTTAGDTIYGGTLICAADGTGRSVIRVCLDNAEPKASIFFTGYQRGSDPAIYPITTGTPEKCGKFKIGDILHGTYSVSDEHFGVLTITVHPTGPAHGATVIPSQRRFDIVPTHGESGYWTLDTKDMDACGYIVRLWVEDRTIVDSGYIGLEAADDAGFCLEEAEAVD